MDVIITPFWKTRYNNIGFGIFLRDSDNNTISENTANNNWYGIFLDVCDDIKVLENIIKDNTNDGIYLYDKSIFEAVNVIKPSDRGELEISDAHQYLLDHGQKITYSEITGWWKDTGKPEDLLEANRLVLSTLKGQIKGTVDKESTLAGQVSLGKGSKIISSHIRGPVIIGKDTMIKNSYIGPYTSIHDKTQVSNSEVEFSIIMENCRIENVGIRIESSILGSNVEIIKAKGIPKTHRFILGTQSLVELF